MLDPVSENDNKAGATGKHDPYAALREPNYRFFASGWVLASMGLQMQGMALAWEVYDRTNDPLMLGYVGVARALPVLALALPAGQLVDLLDRKKVLLWTQVAFACASVFLTLGSYYAVSVWWILVLVSLTGCARVFNGPSRASLLPEIVRPDRFHNAVAWNSGVFQLSATLGPLVAGGMIWWYGKAWPVYAAAAAACIVFAICVSRLKPYPGAVGHGRTFKGWNALRPSAMLDGMLDGARHMWREKTVLGTIALDLFAVLLGGATALLPVYAQDILHVGPRGLGALKAAPYVGALVMAVILAHRPPFKRAGRALLWSVAGFGLCTIVFGLSTSFLLSIAMLFLAGALDGVSIVVRHVLVTVRTPERLRGRVSAVNSVFIESSNELGGFESGLVAKLTSPVFSVVSGGIGTVLVVIGMAWWLPELRRLGKLEAPPEEWQPDLTQCVHCSYDLAGLPIDAMCPECGYPRPVVAAPGNISSGK